MIILCHTGQVYLPNISGEIFGTPQMDAGNMVPDRTRLNGVNTLILFNGTTLISI